MNSDIHLWLLAGMMATAIVEILLSSTWNAFYFRHGLPIFRRSYNTIPGRFEIPSVTELESALKNRFSHSVVFRELNAYEYAFREKVFEFTWFHATPVMHGLLRWHPESGKIVVVGNANWFIIIFTLFWFSLGLSAQSFILLSFLALLGLLYLIQANRFEKVGKMASEKWLKAEQLAQPGAASGPR